MIMSNITHLYAVGDSFVFGQGLPGCQIIETGLTPFNDQLKNTVYSGLIAKRLGIENYINAAMPGSSNNRSVRRVLMDISNLIDEGVDPSNIFVMIGITHSARIEVFSPKANSYVQLINNSPPFKTNKELYSYWETYVTYFDSIVENVDRYIVHVLTMQQFLEKNKIKYLMTDSMTESVAFYDYLKNRRKTLYSHINKKHYPEGMSFSRWAFDKGFPPTECFHVNAEGHAAWADHLLEYIDKENLLEL